MIEPIYRGFDGLDVTFQGRIPEALCAELEASKSMAAEARHPILCEWRGQSFHVAETGAAGGYAYRCDTGPEGAVWFFSKNQQVSLWNIRVSVRSAWLATKGFGRVRAEIYDFLEAIGADVIGEAIARVDYAVDVRGEDLPGFVLEPNNFVMHARCNRGDHYEEIGANGTSGRVTSVTVGKMPGRQAIVYDKTKEVAAKQKAEWPLIWNASLQKQGRSPLADGERVYRVELRAGKAYLKDKWGITTWADLDAKLGDLFQAAVVDIRLCMETNDPNRSRWPVHPLWEAVAAAVAGDLFEMCSGATPGVVKEVRRSQLAKTMSAMFMGLVATWSLATGTEAKAAVLADAVRAMTGDYVAENPKDFAAKLKRAGEKYVFILEEERNAGNDFAVSRGAGEGRGGSHAEPGAGGVGGAHDAGHGHGPQCSVGAPGAVGG